MFASAPAMGETAWPYRCLAPQLGPSWTSSERTFKQCVSPSPEATAATETCDPLQVASNPTILTLIGNKQEGTQQEREHARDQM